MSIVHSNDLDGPAAFGCAQAGCRICQDSLVRQHEGLVHFVLRRYVRGEGVYEDLLQAGRIGLWQAVLHFDVERGVAFSTYAVVAIQRQMWQAAARAVQGGVDLSEAEACDPLESVAAGWWSSQVRASLLQAVRGLPNRLREIVVAAYGLEGEPPRSLAAIGRDLRLSRERVRQLRNEALVLLRLPVFSAHLRRLCEQDTRRAYERTQMLNRAWLRRQRRRRP